MLMLAFKTLFVIVGVCALVLKIVMKKSGIHYNDSTWQLVVPDTAIAKKIWPYLVALRIVFVVAAILALLLAPMLIGAHAGR